jgi:hypothetical protein
VTPRGQLHSLAFRRVNNRNQTLSEIAGKAKRLGRVMVDLNLPASAPAAAESFASAKRTLAEPSVGRWSLNSLRTAAAIRLASASGSAP